MGLNPQVAKFVPQSLCRYCEGLRYPHVFIFLLPAFVIGLLFSYYIPYANEILTALGLAMFLSSTARVK